MSLSKVPPSVSGLVLGWGLRIASAVRIPGAADCPDTGAAADVTVSLTRSQALPPLPGLYQWDGTTLDFAPPGVARYRITRDAIEIAPCPGASRSEIAGLLVATAFPALLWLRGRFVLHAAGLVPVPGGGALAIAGPSGAGKSTLARQLTREGARLLGDDSLAIDSGPDDPLCRGLPGGLFLGSADRRRFTAVPDGLAGARLGAVLVLSPGADAAIGTLAGAAAFDALMQHRHRPRVPAILGQQRVVMDAASALVQTIRIAELRFDKDRHAPQELAAMILNFMVRG